MQQPPDEDASTQGPPRLRVGGRVVSANATPMFASDPALGAKGTVLQADAASNSYQVRWEDGSETWARRDQLSPVGRSALEQPPAGPRPGPSPAPTGSVPRRPPGRGGGSNRLAGRIAPLIFAVFVLQGVLRPLLRGDHHVDPGALVFAAIIGIPLVLGVVRWLRRSTNG
jgi:hypothetical protein